MAHHVVVLARNGVAASGSPWWVDSLNVLANETYDIAFVANNPGIWMDHCHNLKHAAQGMIAHLMYEGVRHPLPDRRNGGQPAGVRFVLSHLRLVRLSEGYNPLRV
jgi:Multicopper oxidase